MNSQSMPKRRVHPIRFVLRPRNLDLSQVSSLLESVGMRVRSQRDMRNAIRNSTEVVVAFAGDEVVGFGRLISDDVYYGSLWDIAVSPTFQRRAIGSGIVKRLLAAARKKDLYMIGLFTALDNRRFYEGLQFSLLQDIHPMTIRREKLKRPRVPAKK
jgi:ribosomal protein S18 acetylase RimI-like enzyme